jgi:hypothetical protein
MARATSERAVAVPANKLDGVAEAAASGVGIADQGAHGVTRGDQVVRDGLTEHAGRTQDEDSLGHGGLP